MIAVALRPSDGPAPGRRHDPASSRGARSRDHFSRGGRREGGRRRVVRCPRPGQVLGLVGESGSGKSVTGYSDSRARRPSRPHRRGFDRLRGTGTHEARCRGARAIRGRRISMVFQDATATLNPVLSIGTQMLLAARAHEPLSERAARALCLDTLASRHPGPGFAISRLSAPALRRHAPARRDRDRAPARPALIIADEPTTALDVSVQAQIIHEMRGLVRNSGTSLIWITTSRRSRASRTTSS